MKKLFCLILGHKYYRHRKVNAYIKEVGCKRCGGLWAMNTQVECLLPLDKELRSINNQLTAPANRDK